MPRGNKKRKKNQQRWAKTDMQSIPNINFYNEDKNESIVYNKRKKKNKKNLKKRDDDHDDTSTLYLFIDQLQALGVTIRSVECDGNSLFRAISDQLSGHESNHYIFRKEIVEYMTLNKDEFSPFYIGDFDTYLTKMSMDGIYGGNMELTAAAKRYKIDIIIHCFNTPRYEILYELGQPLKSIHLSYHNERTYGSVRKLDDINSLYPADTINLNKNDNIKMEKQKEKTSQIAWSPNDGNINNLSLNEEEVILIIMTRTGCSDIDKIKKVLKESGDDMNDIDNVIDIILKEENIQKIETLDDNMEELKMNDIVNNNDDDVINGIICCCGHKNKNDWTFCSNCGWNLRMNGWINCGPLERKRGKKRRKGKKGKIEDDIKCNNNIIDNKWKYNKYRNKYWICKQCKFWNIKTRKNCMVCSMLGVVKDENNNNISQSKKNKMELNGNNNNNDKIIANSLVNLVKNNESKQVKQIKQKKKNVFGWICDRCTMENKPSFEYCALCGYGKLRKGGKKKENKKQQICNTWICECTLINDDKAIQCAACNRKRVGVDNNNNDDIGGNNHWKQYNKKNKKPVYHHSDHCGSGKKYKKCCKKLEKYQNKSYKKKFKNIEREIDELNNNMIDGVETKNNNNNTWKAAGSGKCHCGSGKKYKKCCKRRRNDNSYYGNNGYNQYKRDRNDGYDVIDQLNDIIDGEERKILHFKGKKQDKIRMMKELDKTKNQRNILMKKMENDRNKAIKARNKQNGEMEQETDEHKEKVQEQLKKQEEEEKDNNNKKKKDEDLQDELLDKINQIENYETRVKELENEIITLREVNSVQYTQLMEANQSLNELQSQHEDEKKQDENKKIKNDLKCLEAQLTEFSNNYNKNKIFEIYSESSKELVVGDEINALDIRLKSFSKYFIDTKSYIHSLIHPKVNKYKEWNIDQIIQWISTLENGRYKQYLIVLRSGFEKDAIDSGEILPDIGKQDLRIEPYNISNFKDRRDLANHFMSLKTGHIQNNNVNNENNEGTATAYL